MIYILFHAKKVNPFRPCMDGLFAAYVAKSRLTDAILVPAVYGEPPELELMEGDAIYLLDLTYPAPVLMKWAEKAGVIVLDHHKSAMNDLQGLSGAITTEFDMNRSGAVMAWNYFFPDKTEPLLFRYVQDRDLWRKKLPDCDLISLGLSEIMHDLTLDQCMDEINDLFECYGSIEVLVELGKSAQAEIDEVIDYAKTYHTTKSVLGYTTAYFICKTDRQRQAYSDIGNALAKLRKDCDFAIIQTGDGWALRSTGFDVSRIAKMLGGGGHNCASGCKAELPYSVAKLFN
jgi:uncharacterized protein